MVWGWCLEVGLIINPGKTIQPRVPPPPQTTTYPLDRSIDMEDENQLSKDLNSRFLRYIVWPMYKVIL